MVQRGGRSAGGTPPACEVDVDFRFHRSGRLPTPARRRVSKRAGRLFCYFSFAWQSVTLVGGEVETAGSAQKRERLGCRAQSGEGGRIGVLEHRGVSGSRSRWWDRGGSCAAAPTGRSLRPTIPRDAGSAAESDPRGRVVRQSSASGPSSSSECSSAMGPRQSRRVGWDCGQLRRRFTDSAGSVVVTGSTVGWAGCGAARLLLEFSCCLEGRIR